MMKKLFFLPLLFACSLQAQTIKVLTYNIRLDNPGDGPDRWEVRKAALAAEVLRHQPSVAGFQEVTKVQIDFLDAELKGYQRFGVGREDGKDRGEFSPIYFDTTLFELVSGRTIWMSATPETPGKGWDAACERIATMVQLKHRVGKDTICVVNTHWDHIGQTARLNSATLVLKNLEEVLAQKKRVVFMGDLNATPETPPIESLKKALVEACPESQSSQGTFNGFKVEATTGPRIDYIWMSPGNWYVDHYEVPQPKVQGRQVSDHFPVIAVLRAN